MTRYEELEQIQAFARIDGVLMAGLWAVSFACFIGNFTTPILGLLSIIIGVFSLVFAAMRVKRFRDNVCEGSISLGKALAYSLLQYLHAALLFAAVQFIYFQFIDNGYLMAHYSVVMSTPEFLEMMKIYGLKQEDVTLVMQNLAAMRPIDNALQFFTTNIMMGFAVSIPVAFLIRRKPRNRRFPQQ